MGRLNELFGFSAVSKESETVKRRKSLRHRICRLEEVERREFLSASPYVAPDPINVGIVYHEDYYEGLGVNQGDKGGDTFIVAWNGGVDGTTLDRIIIDLNKDTDAPNSATIHFNIDGRIPNRDGTYYDFDANLPENIGNGITVKSAAVSNDGKTLTIEFEGFTSDKKFYFKIDVDEISGEMIPTVDRLVTGNEMEGASVSGIFSTQNYEDSPFSFKMVDFYSDEMALNLGLPPDAWYSYPDDHDNTAGALGTLNVQTPLCGSISGYVYEDVNNDGLKDPGEAGINGVWLELYFYNENTGRYETTGLKTQTHNDVVRGDGYYFFNNIEGGKTYKVVETQPDGYLDGKDMPGTIGGEQVGVSWEPDQLSEIHIGANEHGINYNFGELKSASLSGYVYHDRNNNGKRETGEEGIANVTLKLQILNTAGSYVDVPDAVTTTDAGGHYIFENLDPFRTYRIIETQPTGWVDGKDSVGSLGGEILRSDYISGITPKFDEHGIEYNFGEYKKGSIGGTVYEDDNNDGKKDPDEKGIPGVEIWLCILDENGNKVNIRKTFTDENGNYLFDDLDPGETYCVTEIQPEEYCDGITTPGNLGGEINVNVPEGYDQIHNIFLDSDQHGTNYNFGEGTRGSLSGYVYEDVNKNGQKDDGEAGIQGVELTLWVWDGTQYIQTSKTATTDADGFYEFTNLCPFKTYQILETQPMAYDDGEETVGSLGGDKSNNDIISDIDMPSGGQGTGYNFGELIKPPPKGSISGYVYVDADKNGNKDPGEPGIAGVTLTLRKVGDANFEQTTTTDTNGYYVFGNLDPNETYMIDEAQPLDYDDGLDSVGTINGVPVGSLPYSDRIEGIFIGPGQHGINYNFGENIPDPPPPPLPGSLSGYVYVDANRNGIRDAGEVGIPGVRLTLTCPDAPTQYATTDANGYYIFLNLDPDKTYQISEDQPKDYDDGAETVGTINGVVRGTLPTVDNDTIIGIVVGSDEHGENYNFGELVRDVLPPAPEKGSISGYVYVDANENGLRDAGEIGIAGVTITLTKTGDPGFVRTTTTDSNGFYIFTNLDPNEEYHLAETQPTAYDDGWETVGSLGGVLPLIDNDTILHITVLPGEHGENYNFGEFEKIVVPPPQDILDTPDTPYVPPYVPPPDRAMGVVGIAPVAASPTWQPPILLDGLRAGYGGGGLQSGYSWHLSVVNGGYPRADVGADGIVAGLQASAQTMILDGGNTDSATGAQYVSVAWTPEPMDQGAWYVRDSSGKITRRFKFGPNGGTPIVGDFAGDGIARIAVYHEGNWYIDLNGNGVWDEGDLLCQLGTSADQPVVGDWDGDGKVDIGIFGPQWSGDAAIVAEEPGLPSDLNDTITSRPKNMPPDVKINASATNVRAMKHSKTGQTRLDVIDHVFQYGDEGDQAFSGDFSGDGITKIGIYRKGNWYIDYNGNGRWDDGDIYIENAQQGIGTNGVAVVGDWTGDGIDKIGLYVNGVWHLDTKGDFQFDTTIEFGESGDLPVVGDFDGDGITQLAVYRPGSTDSLLTQRTPKDAPARDVAVSAPKLSPSMGAAKVARQHQGDEDTGQKTLPEKLQRHGRTMHTPHTDAPLKHRHRDR